MTEQEKVIPSLYRQEAWFWFERCQVLKQEISYFKLANTDLKAQVAELKEAMKGAAVIANVQQQEVERLKGALNFEKHDREFFIIENQRLKSMIDDNFEKAKQVMELVDQVTKDNDRLRKSLEDIANSDYVCHSGYCTANEVARQALAGEEKEKTNKWTCQICDTTFHLTKEGVYKWQKFIYSGRCPDCSNELKEESE